MKTKFYFLISLASFSLSIFAIDANAQTPHIDFTYDATGNRTQRQYFAFKTMGDTAASDPVAEETAVQYGITVYPNPLMDGTSATVTILNKVEGEENAKTNEEPAPIEASRAIIYVLDNTGKVLSSQHQIAASTAQIDLSGYSAGIYHIKVAIGKEVLFYKIVKGK